MLLTKANLAMLAVGAMLSLRVMAAPMEVSGVRFADPVSVGGTPLQLNGAGTRYQLLFKVYAAGLYMRTKAATPEEVYVTPGPKRLSITLLRDVEADLLARSMTEGFENNTPAAEKARFRSGLDRMLQAFAEQKKLNAGDNFTVDSIPGTGTILAIKGVQQGEPFKGDEFFNALIRLWVGPRPADAKLKDSLLGKGAS